MNSLKYFIDTDKETNKLEEVVNKCDNLCLNVGHNGAKNIPAPMAANLLKALFGLNPNWMEINLDLVHLGSASGFPESAESQFWIVTNGDK